MSTYHISQAKETGSKLKISGAIRGKGGTINHNQMIKALVVTVNIYHDF